MEVNAGVWAKEGVSVVAGRNRVSADGKTATPLSDDGSTKPELAIDMGQMGGDLLHGLIRQPHRKIRSAAADGAYDTRLCHDELRRKKITALIPPRKGAGYWPAEYADRNRAVANQRLSGSNARRKWTTDYNRRSIAETAMYSVKQLFGGSLTLRDYDGQVAESLAIARALNKMTKGGMSESVRIA